MNMQQTVCPSAEKRKLQEKARRFGLDCDEIGKFYRCESVNFTKHLDRIAWVNGSTTIRNGRNESQRHEVRANQNERVDAVESSFIRTFPAARSCVIKRSIQSLVEKSFA